jgi:sugar/nucleoside kinase (ribokinase family)
MERIRESGPEIVVATWGRRGALMLAEERRYHIPAFPTQPLDPTGAGDAFMGGFLSQYLREKDALWSASVGASLSSSLIETQGCRIDASVGEILERANWVRERIERL